MARGALALVWAIRELILVRILMAIHTLLECDRLFEIPFGMALNAVNRGVFAKEWKFRLRVIESLVLRHFLPRRGRMASFAGLRERFVVRIAVAIAAPCERDAGKPRLAARRGGRV